MVNWYNNYVTYSVVFILFLYFVYSFLKPPSFRN